MAGRLYIVATPLGNLDDLSPRAREVLENVAAIACEDTRRTAVLLTRFGISTPTFSCHRFNERRRRERVLERLANGEDVALVSDGGTPGVSDPGAEVVAAAVEGGHEVVPVPGPSAAVSLLSVSGLPGGRFRFEGFLPHRAGERRRRLRDLRGEAVTLVLFEAPHRIRGTLRDVAEILGDRPLVLGRELSKLHETILRGTAAGVLEALGEDDPRGEITLVVAGAPPGEGAVEPRAERVAAVWRRSLDEAGRDRRDALRRAARTLKMKRSELYRLLTELGLDRD